MLPDRVSNPGPLTYEPGALPIALRGPARQAELIQIRLLLANSLIRVSNGTVLQIGIIVQKNFNDSNSNGSLILPE